MNRFSSFILSLVFLPLMLHSQTFTDIPGPMGNTRCFLPAPNGEVYLGTNSKGVYRSADGGKTWSGVGGNTIMAGRINDMIFDRNGQILAVTEQGGVKRWDGASWKSLNMGLFSACGIIIPLRAVAKDSSGVVFAGGHSFSCFPQGDVYRLSDSVWTSIGAGLGNFNVNTLAVHPLTQVLYAGTDGGIFKYENSTWTPVNAGLPGPGVRNLYFLPGGDLLAGTDGGPAKLPDGASNWINLAPGWNEGPVTAIASSDPAGQKLLIGTGYTLEQRGSLYGKIFLSENSGNSWLEVSGALETTGINDLVFTGAQGALAAGWGIFRSADMGNSWGSSNTGFSGKTFNSQGRIAVTPMPDKALFYGSDDGLFKTSDNGQHWHIAGKGIERHIITLLKADHSGKVFCGAMRYEPGVGFGDGNLYVSSDNGETWQEVQISEDWRYMEVSELPNGNLICAHGFGAQPPSATITGSSLALSADHGSTWNDLDVKSGMAFCCTSNASGHMFVAGESQTLYRSTDNGQHFELITVAGQQGNVGALETASDGTIFMSSGGQRTLYFSLDSGSNFESFSSTILPDYRGVSDIAFDKDGVAYCTTTGVGMPSLFTISPPFTQDAIFSPVSGLSGSLFKMCWDDCGYLYIYRGGSVLRSENPLGTVEPTCISATNELSDGKDLFKISPNPAEGAISLHFNSEKPKNLQLLHADGRLCKVFNTTDMDFEMDLSEVPAGCYFIVVRQEDGPISGLRFIRI